MTGLERCRGIERSRSEPRVAVLLLLLALATASCGQGRRPGPPSPRCERLVRAFDEAKAPWVEARSSVHDFSSEGGSLVTETERETINDAAANLQRALAAVVNNGCARA
jgi:hypothetical protein